MQKIGEGIYRIPVLAGVVSIYLLIRNDEVTLIDTGLFARMHQKIERELKTVGLNLQNVHHILITHAHPDHIGGLARLQKLTQAAVYAHHLEVPVIQGLEHSPPIKTEYLGPVSRTILKMRGVSSSNWHTEPATVQQEIHDEDILDSIYPGLQVIGTPGHTPGHLSFWLPDRRLLFAGDTLIRVLDHLRLPFALFTSDWQEAQRSARKIAEMNVEILCQAHGNPYLNDASIFMKKVVSGII